MILILRLIIISFFLRIYDLAFSPDGSQLIVAAGNKVLVKIISLYYYIICLEKKTQKYSKNFMSFTFISYTIIINVNEKNDSI